MVTGLHERPRTSARARRWAGRHWASIALVVVGTLYGGVVTLTHDDTVSPIDEVVYLDYAYKVWDQGLVHQGEQFGDDVAQVVACENVLPFGPLGQECGSGDVVLETMPNQGYTTGAAYTPAYFWSARIIGDPIHAVTGLSQVSSWRLSGLLWLAGTMILIASLLRRSGLSNAVTLTLGLLFIASPYTWWTYTYLSTDVSVVFFGAAILLVSMEAVKGRVSPWWLVPLGVLAPIFKITNLLVLGLVLLYLGIDAASRRLRRSPAEGPVAEEVSTGRRLWIPVGTAVVLAGVVQLTWMRLVPQLAVSDVVVDQGISTPLTGPQLVGLMMSGIAGPITHNPFAGFTGTDAIAPLFTPLAWLTIAAVVGAVLVIPWDAERGPVIWATAIASVTALPLLAILMWGLTHSYFVLPARYGAALIPAVLLVAGFMLRNRSAKIIALAYAGVLMFVGVGLAAYVGASF